MKYEKEKVIPKAQDRLEVLKKIELLEKQGKFDVDAEDDPPTIVLTPENIDYLRTKMTSKIKRIFANKVGEKFLDASRKGLVGRSGQKLTGKFIFRRSSFFHILSHTFFHIKVLLSPLYDSLFSALAALVTTDGDQFFAPRQHQNLFHAGCRIQNNQLTAPFCKIPASFAGICRASFPQIAATVHSFAISSRSSPGRSGCFGSP